MPVIHVVKGFTFQHNPEQTGTRPDDKDPTKEVPVFAPMGRHERFEPGYHDVSDTLAGHWYVQAHCEGFVDPPPPLGSPDFLQQQLRAAAAARDGVSMDAAAPQPAPLPPHVDVMRSGSNIPEGAHYFAGRPQEDKQIELPISYAGKPP